MPHSIYTKAWLKKEQVTICWTICFIQVLFFIYGHWDRSFHRKKCWASSESPNKYLIPSNTTLSLVTLVVSGQNFGSGHRFDLAGCTLQDWGHVFKQHFKCQPVDLRGSAVSALLPAMGWVDHSLGREPWGERPRCLSWGDCGHLQKWWVLPLILCAFSSKRNQSEICQPHISFHITWKLHNFLLCDN